MQTIFIQKLNDKDLDLYDSFLSKQVFTLSPVATIQAKSEIETNIEAKMKNKTSKILLYIKTKVFFCSRSMKQHKSTVSL